MYRKITNAKIVTPEKIISGTITLSPNGTIEAITEETLKDSDNETILNANGAYVLPGLIEVHGHLREPGMAQKEDIPHGTRAGLAGGYTTIIDMPNTNPPTITQALLKEKIENIYSGRAYTDFAFFLGAASDHLHELETIDPAMIVGVKLFMAGHETTPTTIPDDATLAKVFAILAKREILVAVHAEDQDLINKYADDIKKTGRTDAAVWSEIRPKAVIVEAVKRAISLAKKTNNQLYLLHLSTPEEFALVQQAKKEGLKVYGELVGYQLAFTIDDYARLGNKIKVAPALRTKEDQNALWELIKTNGIDVLCSEHTPHEWETKNQPNVWLAQAGTPGIQETLPVFITNWVKRYGKENLEEGLQHLVTYAAKNPAEIFGFSTKGELKVGKDADLVILDTENTWTVNKSDLFSKCGWSAYEGMQLIGRPNMTFLRGELVYTNGKIIGDPQGQWLHKETSGNVR